MKWGTAMRVIISDEAAEFIKSKGGQIIVFQGNLTGCCIGKVLSPMLEIGRPRRSLDNYDILNLKSGITVNLDKDLASFDGTGEITLCNNLWWKSLSFNYQVDQT